MKLFEHPEFEQAIIRAAEHFRAQGLRPAIIEKDYYVTEALRILSAMAHDKIIFKGGTSLSKGLLHSFHSCTMGDVYTRLPIVRLTNFRQVSMEKPKMTVDYTTWLRAVRAALASINMPMDQWQKAWPFDFEREFKVGTDAATAADLANRYWWREQNKSIGQHCLTTPDCWLPRNHQGDCQPVHP